MLIMVTGGTRSGKSSFAENYAASLASEGFYIATAQIYDNEMRERIVTHQERRELSGFPWKTFEEPYHLAQLIGKINLESNVYKFHKRVILVDCLSLWLSNWVLLYEQQDTVPRVNAKINELVNQLKEFQTTIIVVTNEVGSGIVPEYPLGRMFRDLTGMMNQQIASISRQVFLVTAGIPMELKSREFKLKR